MSTPMKPWENTLENNGHILRNSNLPQVPGAIRSVPLLPPRPQTMSYNNGYSSYSPYSSIGSSYGGYGGYNSMPYRSSMYGGGYNSYGTGSYGMYGMGTGYGTGYGPGYGVRDDAETRFVQFAEERSRNTFANVESIVRAFNSMAMMLDNTFFAMTSSFRAVLGVAENFGRLRSMFGHVWHALNIFRLFKWLYRKMMGAQASGGSSLAWREAVNGGAAEAAGSGGSSWPTLAFIGVLLSAPYFISKWLPKYEDKLNPDHWKQSGIPAKAVFDFAGSSQNELTLHTNDDVLLAPKTIQEEMKLTNSGWAYAACNGRSGVVPLNYIVIKRRPAPVAEPPVANKAQKRVSFGENQIFEMKKEEEQSACKDVVSES